MKLHKSEVIFFVRNKNFVQLKFLKTASSTGSSITPIKYFAFSLQRQSLLIRQSKGNPLYAKPVGIPIVPVLPKQENIVKMESKLPAVSPHKINKFVYEEDNRIILDFGPNNIVAEDRTHSPSSESSKSSSGIY